MKNKAVICIWITIFQGCIVCQVFKANQQEEDCGIFDATTHKNHKEKPDQYKAIFGAPKKDKNLDHLELDSTVLNRTWPWQVMISSGDKYLCNGLLVRNNWVMATASCLAKKTTSLKDETKTYVVNVNGMMYEGDKLNIHEGYDETRPKKMAGDIAVLKLTKSIPYTTRVGIYPICLPRSNLQLRQASECAVTYATYGDNNETKTFDSPAKLIDNKFCKKNNVSIDGAEKLLICIAITSKMKVKCDGKQVMFLMCKSSGFWTVFGQSKLCSLAENKGVKYSFTYYLNMIPYVTWVKEQIGNKKTRKSKTKNTAEKFGI